MLLTLERPPVAQTHADARAVLIREAPGELLVGADIDAREEVLHVLGDDPLGVVLCWSSDLAGTVGSRACCWAP
jgi:hypothetical protein